MSGNRVIGDQGKIPWHLPEDFRWFKHKTMGGALVMGRKTFESIGKPLPGRRTIILSRRAEPDFQLPTYTFNSLDKDVANHPGEAYWIAGGGEIYSQFLDHCHYLYLTMVKRVVAGDVYFPSAAHVEKNHALEQIIHETSEFRIERWKHKTVPPDCVLPAESWPFPPRTN